MPQVALPGGEIGPGAEVALPYSITSSAVASSEGGTLRPNRYQLLYVASRLETVCCNRSGSLAMLAAMRRASWLVSRLLTSRRGESSSK